MVRIVPLAALLALLCLIQMHLIVAERLSDGVASYVCYLPGNPWLAAGQIERRVDGCAWEANGWAER